MNKYTAIEKEILILKYKQSKEKLTEFCKVFNVSITALKKWIEIYDKFGIEGLDDKAFNRLTSGEKKEETLKREIIKLRIENERLKKGYAVRENGAKKEFVTISDPNLKS